MAFGVVKQEPTGGGKKKEIDYDVFNEYLVEAAGIPERETMQGVIACICDLGLQEQEDSEMVFTGSEAEEAEIIKQYPKTFFKDGKDPKNGRDVRLKCWPNPVAQNCAVAVEFPQIIVDKAKWFGEESKPLPLRIWLGGQFYTKESGMIIQRMTSLRVSEKLKDGWSLNQKNLFYKLAVASKIVSAGQPFLPDRIDELLGKSFNWTVSVSLKPSADGKKKYLQEYCVFAGAIARGQPVIESDVKPALIQFDVENDLEDVKNLRKHVVSTIRLAHNFSGSILEAQLEKVKGSFKPAETDLGEPETPDEEPTKPTPKPKATKPTKAVKPEPASDPFDDEESPF